MTNMFCWKAFSMDHQVQFKMVYFPKESDSNFSWFILNWATQFLVQFLMYLLLHLRDTAKTQTQDLHFQHIHTQQAWGRGGREGVLLGAESGGQTSGGSTWITQSLHLNILALFRSCLNVVWLQFLLMCFWKLHSRSALVGLCPWLRPRNQMCVYSLPHSTPPHNS